jgi:chromosome segregation ATPase
MPRNPPATEQLATLKDQVLALQEILDDTLCQRDMAFDASRTMRLDIDARSADIRALTKALEESRTRRHEAETIVDELRRTLDRARLSALNPASFLPSSFSIR